MTASSSPVALVTGANKGIGQEVARRLGRLGMTVLIGSRSRTRGEDAAAELRAEGADARQITIDVTDEYTIEAARRRIEAEFGRLDILVNNAGVSLERERRSPSDTPIELVRRTYAVNVFGVMAVTDAMSGLLRRSPVPRIVNVSSTMGSSSIWSDPGSDQRLFAPALPAYDTSKAALNSATVHYAVEFSDTPAKVNAASPAYVATDLNDHQGQVAVTDEESVAAIVRLATLPDDGPTGAFHDVAGAVPW